MSDDFKLSRVIDLFITGIPEAEPRARATHRNGFTRMYTPATADGWRASVRAAMVGKIPASPIATAASLYLTFYFPRPKRLQTRKANPDEFPYTQKPDLDNLEKLIKDEFTKLGVWTDDAIVWRGGNSKRWVMKDGTRGPGVHVTVYDDTNELTKGPSNE